MADVDDPDFDIDDPTLGTDGDLLGPPVPSVGQIDDPDIDVDDPAFDVDGYLLGTGFVTGHATVVAGGHLAAAGTVSSVVPPGGGPPIPQPIVIARDPRDLISDPVTRTTRRVDILNFDFTPYYIDVPFTEGAVSVDGTRDERRTLDLTIESDHDIIKIGEGYIWYDKVIRVYRGVTDGVNTGEWLLGTFMMDSIESYHFPDTLHIVGRDFTKKLLVSTFGRSTTFQSGMSLDVALMGVATAAGVSNFAFPWNTTDNPAPHLGGDHVYEAGATRWSAVNEMATSFSYEAFIDVHGFLVVREFRDPSVTPPIQLYETGPTGNLVSFTRRANDSRLYNHVVVTGDGQQTLPAFGEAQITDTASPIHASRIGDRMYRYVSSFITTDAQAQAVADNFLAVHSLESYEVDLGSLVYPWLEATEVVSFQDPDPRSVGDPYNYLLSNFSIPLGLEPMTANVRRVLIAS